MRSSSPNPWIVHRAATDFVPFAGDQFYLRRAEGEVGRFFWKVAQQGHYRNRPMDETRQGIYLTTPDGILLGSTSTLSPRELEAELTRSLEAWTRMRRLQPENRATLEAGAPVIRPDTGDGATLEPTIVHRLPSDGLAIEVFSRILLEPPADGVWTPTQAIGRDHLWLLADEWRALAPKTWRDGETYDVPRAIAVRIARFHLVDNVRGEPPMWTKRQVKALEMRLEVVDAADGRVQWTGKVQMQAPEDGGGTERGYQARLQGTLTFDRRSGRLSGLELLAWGEAWGRGMQTHHPPPGRFPLVVAFRLAGDGTASRIPPQAARDIEAYYGRKARWTP